jgi:two-component system, OmpR family, sensor kinase
MSSLRARVLASLLVLASAGLLALAAVTYTEQRSFLEGRLDQQARFAVPVIHGTLSRSGRGPLGERFGAPGTPATDGAFGPPVVAPGAGGGAGGPRGGGQGGPHADLQPGTYGELRDASGKVLRHVFITFGQRTPAAPKLPAHVPVGRLFTVGSVGSSGPQYRVFASRDVDTGGLTIAAVPTSEVQQTLHHLLLVEALVIVAVLLTLAIVGSLVVRLGLRPLNRMEATAGKIAAGDLSHRVSPANESTEVGRLGLALNAMLDRLEEAFQQREASQARLRRFLADASHELRTPLASIRGYAELFRMGATADPAATENAMRRIEEEAERMGVLVEDLLALARLDRPPEHERERVDFSELAADAVADARAVAPDRTITLEAEPGACVVGDPLQLRQVLANLLRNALTHTPAASPVEVAVCERDGAITLSVRDHGPGLPTDSPEQLFERFWRAEGGRERGRGGAGLGLAITRAVVEAHGGSISARPASGGGAEFLVRLPAERAPRAAEAATA